MRIIGAGMAGLLAASMLRRHKPWIEEAQASLPNNHAALLRFRTDACSVATGIPFKRVFVQKAISYKGELRGTTRMDLNNMYSQKVAGVVADRSIINLAPGERFIAPEDFIAQMASVANVKLSSPLMKDDVLSRGPDSSPMISTVPMPVLMDMVGWPSGTTFSSKRVWSVTATVSDCDVYQTVYYPELSVKYYRASLTGSLMTAEYVSKPEWIEKDCADILSGLGISATVTNVKIKEQQYGKLVPLSAPSEGRKFMLFMTDRYRVYSLGRFATWRQLLLDDVVKDVRFIERLIETRDDYQAAVART